MRDSHKNTPGREVVLVGDIMGTDTACTELPYQVVQMVSLHSHNTKCYSPFFTIVFLHCDVNLQVIFEKNYLGKTCIFVPVLRSVLSTSRIAEDCPRKHEIWSLTLESHYLALGRYIPYYGHYSDSNLAVQILPNILRFGSTFKTYILICL